MNKLSVERLHEVLSYDPENGEFRWKVGHHRMVAGHLAGTVTYKGYLMLRVDRIGVRAHRAAWAMTHGQYPELDIDHINRNRLDNRIANLRLATAMQSSHNRSVRRDSGSGLKGVTWYKSDKLWCARITIRGKRLFLGLFKAKEDAAKAYAEAAKQHHGAFAAT